MVLQGERPMAADNKTLGRFHLDGIPPAPRGVPQIEVKFDIDANGILSVSAKDKATGKEQSIRIEASSGLSKEEIERMKKEAEANADVDAKKRELIETRNLAETMVYTTEKMMKDVEEKKIAITDEEKKKVTDALEAVKALKDSEDIEALKKAADELSNAGQAIGAKMYSQEQAQQAQSAAGATDAPGADKKDSQPGGEGPIEGEVVDDKK